MIETETAESIDFAKLMRADQALEWLTPILRSRTIAKTEIADLMRDGLIDAYARRAWDSTTVNAATAWKQEPDEDDEFTALELEIDVGTWVWRRSRQWLLDQMDWRWPSGRFSVVHRLKQFRRIMIEHVHFDPIQIKQLGDSRSGSAKQAPGPLPLAQEGELQQPLKPDDTMFEGESKGKNKRGRRVRGQAWAVVCQELLRLRDAGELSASRLRGCQNIARDLAQLTKKSGYLLEAGTIEPLVTELIKTGFIAK